MGIGSYYGRFGPYGIRDKLDVLGWINEDNVPLVSEGTYFLSPSENDSSGTSNLHGLEIPIQWEEGSITLEGIYQLASYYLEYGAYFEEVNPFFEQPYTAETFYGLNLSNLDKGILIRLGVDFSGLSKNWLLSMHPNLKIC